MKELLTAVAAELGDEWTYQHNPFQNFHDDKGVLRGPDGVLLWVSTVGYGVNAGRLELFPDYHAIPNYTNDDCPSYIRPSITVSPERTAKAIAADITRRLLPQSIEHVNKVKQAIAQRLERTQYTQSLASSLCTIANGDDSAVKPSNSGCVHSFRLPYKTGQFYGHVDCRSIGVDMRLDNLSPEQARKILNALYS